MRLFSVPKIALFLDSYAPGIEKRRGDEIKIITLTLRVQPFDATLATAIDAGLGDDSNVRGCLFALNDAEPKPHLARVNFVLECPRQNLIVYASPDTTASRMAFLQAKIAGAYARTQKDVRGFAFTFKASFGPVSRDEQEFIHEWMLSQRFVTFEASEPLLEDADDGDDDDDEDQDATVVDGRVRPAPMWDDATEGVATDAAPRPQRARRKHA